LVGEIVQVICGALLFESGVPTTNGLVELIMRSVRRNGRVTKPFYVSMESRHGRNTERHV
jgi:hypothetical protein